VLDAESRGEARGKNSCAGELAKESVPVSARMLDDRPLNGRVAAKRPKIPLLELAKRAGQGLSMQAADFSSEARPLKPPAAAR